MSSLRARRAVDVSRGFRPLTKQAEKLDGPDPCDVEGVHARLGSATWATARVVGGDELRVIRRLGERGIFAFTPVNEVWRRRDRTCRHKTLFRYPAAPGYVVAAIEGPFPRWVNLMTCPGVLELIRYAGTDRPRAMASRDVERMVKAGSQAPAWERLMDSRSEWSAAVGDALTILRGPFSGRLARMVVPLTEASRKGLTVAVEMFGREIEVLVPVRDLVPT